MKCNQCGWEIPKDSKFCNQCGERLSVIQKSVKGTKRKCRHCDRFNELDALFCTFCGEEITKLPKESLKKQSSGPSYKTIVLFIGIIFLLGTFVKLGTTFFREESRSRLSFSPVPISRSVKVDEAQVMAVAKNFKCACGGCGELPLATCNCDMQKGSVEEKSFIREKLAEGFSVEQVIELLDKKYGHRV